MASVERSKEVAYDSSSDSSQDECSHGNYWCEHARPWKRGHHQQKWHHGRRGWGGGRWGDERKAVWPYKAWKKSMKEARKAGKKAAKKHAGHHGEKHGEHLHDKTSMKEDIFIYMGDYEAEEIRVTFSEGQVKISGRHDSGESYCRPHSVVHTYAAPSDTSKDTIRAVLHPLGMLQVKFVQPDEVPIELPIGDDVTMATDSVASMAVA